MNAKESGWIALVPLILLGASLMNEQITYPILLTGAALIVGAAIAAQFHSFELGTGLIALMISGVLFPRPFGPNDELSLPLVIACLICGYWLVGLMFGKQGADGPLIAGSGTGLLLVAVSLAALFIGQLSVYPVSGAPPRAQVAGFGIIALSVCLFLCSAYGVRSLRSIKWFTGLFLAAGAIVLLLSRPELDAIAVQTINPKSIGSVFWTCFVGVSAGQALFNSEMHPLSRVACLALAVIALADSMITRSAWASGWLPPLVAAGVAFVLRAPKIALSGGLVAVPVAFYALMPTFRQVLETESYSLASRKAAWSTMWHVISPSPILGLGPANYYHYTELFPTLGWYVKFSSHQQYIDLVAQTGVVGLFIFLAFVAVVLRSLWKLRNLLGGGFQQGLVSGCLAAGVGCLASGFLADWILPFVYNIGLEGFRSSLLFWTFLGLAMALHRIRRQDPQSTTRALRF